MDQVTRSFLTLGSSEQGREEPAPGPLPTAHSQRRMNTRFSSLYEEKEQLADRTLTCRDCAQEFTFTEGEQAFYTSRGFSDPVRCPTCRQAKKANRGSSDYGDSYG